MDKHPFINAEAFNNRIPLGSIVDYFPVLHGSNPTRTITQSNAWDDSAGQPVVMIKGKSGYVSCMNLTYIAPPGFPDPDAIGARILNECVDSAEGHPAEVTFMGAARIVREAMIGQHAAVSQLQQFIRWLIREGPWEGGMPDGGEVQDKAVEMGLLEKRIANEMNADEWRDIEGVEEIGDTYYVFSKLLKEQANVASS